MSDVVFGLIAIIAGLVFCFRGYLAMRLVIPIWGVFAGFALGAGLVSSITDRAFLGTVTGWLLGAVLGLVFGALAYLYFEVSIVVGMGAIGFVLGTSVMVAFNVTWTWLVVLVGVIVAVLLAVLAMAGNLPMVVLTVLTAFAGASVTVGGFMLLAGSLSTADFDKATIVERINDSAGWWALYLVLAIAGMVAQIRAVESLTQTVRAEWELERGRSAR